MPDTFPAGWLGGWGQSDIKDHPSPAKARVGAELGNSLNGGSENVYRTRNLKSKKLEIQITVASYNFVKNPRMESFVFTLSGPN